MATVNQLKHQAQRVLLSTTFAYTRQTMYTAYTALAKENAKLQEVYHPDRVLFFMHQGTVYPDRSPSGMPIQNIPVRAPLLHYSLISRAEKIMRQLEDAGFTEIKNLFSAILTDSFNGIVLETFLPQVLLAALQKTFTKDEYYAINFGCYIKTKTARSLDTTTQNIRMIKEFYREALCLLKERLMEQFLLQH